MGKRRSADVPLYPPERAFVVQFRSGAFPAGSPCRGRVEHIPSGRSARFDDAKSLLDFMERTLTSADTPAAQDPREESGGTQ